MTDMSLVYFSDPMCSWCWGIATVIAAIEDAFGEAASLFQHGVGKLRCEIRERVATGQRIRADDGIEGVVQVVQRRAVHRCGASSTVGRAKRRHCPGPEV